MDKLEYCLEMGCFFVNVSCVCHIQWCLLGGSFMDVQDSVWCLGTLAGYLALPLSWCKDPWLARAGFCCHLRIMERDKYFYPPTSWQLVIIVSAAISAVVIVLGHSLSPWITSCCLNYEPSLENILKCPVNAMPFFFLILLNNFCFPLCWQS